LDEAERARASGFRVEWARREFVAGRALLRAALTRYADVPPGSWAFQNDARGKPHLVAGSPALSFNVSHSSGVVACIVARKGRVGVDVESRARSTDPLDLAKRYFAPQEAEELMALSDGQQRRRFFEMWTLKEAYAKARGLGLGLAFDSFTF